MSKGFEAICPKCGTLQDYSCPVCETNKKKYNEIKDKGEMKNKHSPGIWWIGSSYENQHEGHVAIHSPSWGALAEVYVGVDGNSSEEGWANAHLIVASVELYEACLSFVNTIKKGGEKELNEAYQLAQKAIAKAEEI